MFDDFLSALDDYLDFREEQERERSEYGESRRWNEQMGARRAKIVGEMRKAFGQAVEGALSYKEPK
jgi:hypothetical protein